MLFPAMGAEISIEDIDIAHRTPSRSATSGPKTIICKFSSRLTKDNVINRRNELSKLTPNSVGLPEEESLSDAKMYDHLTPEMQKLLVDAKKFQQRYRYSFCWVKKNITILLKKSEDSRPVMIRSFTDLQDLAEQEWRAS